MKEPLLAGTSLDPYYHVCAFFNSREDEYRVLAAFYQETIDWGEKLMHVVDDRLVADHDARMEQLGFDVCGCRASGQYQVYTWGETYLKDGVFEQEKMIDAVRGVIAEGRAAGFPRTRIMGNMNWALEGAPGSDRLIDYEVRVNDVLSEEKQPAVCVYDASRLTGAMMLDILRAHPLTLVNGVVHRNPFFTPPDQMLSELRQRRESTESAAPAS